MTFELTDAAIDKIVTAGYDPVYGARPLKRSIQRYIENVLAQDILSSKFMAGDHIIADVEGDQLCFKAGQLVS